MLTGGTPSANFGTLVNDGPHGGPFRYRSILTDVLAWVIERAVGERLHNLFSRELWQPMDAEFDADITVDGHGNPLADGGISATLRDVARFGLLFLRRGRSGGRQIVPAWWIEDRRLRDRDRWCLDRRAILSGHLGAGGPPSSEQICSVSASWAGK